MVKYSFSLTDEEEEKFGLPLTDDMVALVNKYELVLTVSYKDYKKRIYEKKRGE